MLAACARKRYSLFNETRNETKRTTEQDEMTKFYEVHFEDEEPSLYVVLGSSVALLREGELVRTLMTVKDCNALVSTGRATAH